MRRLNAIGRCVGFALIANFLLFAQGSTSVLEYVEDFTTTQFKDTLNTTALWDTAAGELRLPPFELTLAGSYDTPSSAFGVAIAGDYAYVADWYSGLQVMDISDPTTPTLAGSYNTSGQAYGIALAGDYAYVADYGSGLTVIDISDPTTPTLAGSYNTSGYAYGVALAGDYAYVADYGSGLTVIDISDPTTPTLAGSYDTPGFARGVALAGDCAYVADLSSGLQVIDISDPTIPTLAGSYDTPGLAFAVALAGDYAYVADQSSGLQVIDISDPTAPTLAGSYNTSGYALGIGLAGDYAYVADGDSGFTAIDISDPTAPTLACSYDTPGNAWSVALAGDYAYVADGNSGLQVIDISDPTPPTYAGSRDGQDGPWGVAVEGDYAYVADLLFLSVIDISEPTVPTLVGSYSGGVGVVGVVIAGDHAYLAAGNSGLLVVDISDPTSPVYAGSYDTPSYSWDVAVAGDYAYVANQDSGLVVVDISDPTTPTYAGRCDTRDQAYDVAIAGNYAYVADDDSGLVIIDISDPTSPAYAGHYDTAPGGGYGVAVDGNYAYVAASDSGLVIVDVSDPTTPTYAGSYNTMNYSWAVAVDGDYAYLADGEDGLQVIDVSDPASPFYLGTYEPHGYNYSRDVALAGDYAYVADRAGVYVIQIYQRMVNPSRNRGQSVVINSLRENIERVKLSASTIGSIDWEVSADSGASWTSVVTDGSWNRVVAAGSSLVWRDSLMYPHLWPAVNPTCTLLEIGWLHDFAIIDSIVDVGGDQGGWARVYFTRSGKDFADEAGYPILGYNIHRRIDDPALVRRILEEGRPVSPGQGARAFNAESAPPTPIVASGENMKMILLDGRFFLVAAGMELSAPPGVWEVVGTVFSQQQDQYVFLAPTLGDSTSTIPYSAYYISAHSTTPSVYYSSPVDSGYSVDNLSPAAPVGLAGDYSYPPAELLIMWDRNGESDLSHYAVYKGDNEVFVPGPGNRLGTPQDTFFVDDSFDPNVDNYYKVSAWDIHENESDFSLLRPEEVTGVDSPPVAPLVTCLEQNVPNPFNPITVIRFSLAQAGWVELLVYDVAGRPVRALIHGRRELDRYQVTWDGLDDSGRAVASGVYLYQLDAPGYRETKKMVLLR